MYKVSRDRSKKFEYEARRKAIFDHYSVLRDAELDEATILELTELSASELEELKKSLH